MYFSQQSVAAAKLALQVLGASQALKLAIDHHCQSGAQSFTLLHTGERSQSGFQDKLKIFSQIYIYIYILV